MSASVATKPNWHKHRVGMISVSNKSKGISIRFIVYQDKHYAKIYFTDNEGQNATEEEVYSLAYNERTETMDQFDFKHPELSKWLNIGKNKEIIFNNGSTLIDDNEPTFEYVEDEYEFYSDGLAETFGRNGNELEWDEATTRYRAFILCKHFYRKIQRYIINNKTKVIRDLENNGDSIFMAVHHAFTKNNEATEKYLDNVLKEHLKVNQYEITQRKNNLDGKLLLSMCARIFFI